MRCIQVRYMIEAEDREKGMLTVRCLTKSPDFTIQVDDLHLSGGNAMIN